MPSSPLPPSSPQGGHRVLLGLAVIAFGVLALLDNLRLFDMALLRTFWPLGLVLWGLSRLAWPTRHGSGAFGAILVGVGLVLTIENLGFMRFHWHDWWPVFVILAGLSILMRGAWPGGTATALPATTLEHGGRVDIDASFSAINQRHDSQQFRGGRITSTFGGVKLDLTQAAIEGPEAVLEVHAHFSGVEVRVPRDWQVVVEVAATLGGVEDKTVPPSPAGARLVLRGTITCGGIEIRH
jgi:predicted membrane protein